MIGYAVGKRCLQQRRPCVRTLGTSIDVSKVELGNAHPWHRHDSALSERQVVVQLLGENAKPAGLPLSSTDPNVGSRNPFAVKFTAFRPRRMDCTCGAPPRMRTSSSTVASTCESRRSKFASLETIMH